MDIVRHDPSTSPAVRDVAKKFRRAMWYSVPPTVPVDAMKVRYLCDSLFEVVNASEDEWRVSVEAGGKSLGMLTMGASRRSVHGEPFIIQFAPHETRRFYLSGGSVGTIRVLDKKTVLATAFAGKRACPVDKSDVLFRNPDLGGRGVIGNRSLLWGTIGVQEHRLSYKWGLPCLYL